MAFDQNSLQKDLSSLNVAGKPGIVTEEPQIADAVEPGTHGSMPVLYPEMVTDAGFVSLGYVNAVPPAPGVPAWRPHMPVPVPVGGFGYNPNSSNMVVGNALDQVSNDVVAGHGYSPSLGNRNSGNGSDQVGNDRVPIGYAHSFNMGNRGSGNVSDQSSNELKPNLGLGPLGSNGNGADQVSDEGGDDSVSRKKVKLLCSFGGKILPRPGDGMLRYVGGQTRIISVRRDVSFDEFVRKMVDAYGQSVAIKYQLPDEDLDALVSISCSDDLDNMMDEYEKVVERSSDGSAKLRVFLFSALELDPSSMVQLGDLHDNVQKYVEAVNGIVDGAAGGIMRKASIASAGSTQNSDISGIEAVDSTGAGQGDVGVSPSTNMLSPSGNSATSHDRKLAVHVDVSGVHLGSPVAKSGPPQTLLSQHEVESGRTVPLTSTTQQMGYDLNQHYASTYIDPRHEVTNRTVHLAPQIGFLNPELMGNTGSVFSQQELHDNAAPHQYIPAFNMTMTPFNSHVGIRPTMVQPLMQHQQTPLEHYPYENAFGTRVIQHPVDLRHGVYQTQIPSAMVAGGYTFHHIPQTENAVFSDGSLRMNEISTLEKIPRIEDCFMCQKALPHAHFDPSAPDQRDGGVTPLVNTDSIYHSQHPEDSMGISSVNKVVVAGSNGIAEQQAGIRHIVYVDNQVGGLQSLDAQNEHERNISPRVDNSNRCRIPASQDLMDLAGELQSPYVLPTQYQFRTEVPNAGAVGIQVSEQPGHEASNVPDVPKEDILNETSPQIVGKEVHLDNIFSQPVESQTLDFVAVRYRNPPFSGVDSAHTSGLDDVSWVEQKIAQSNTEAAPSNANSQAYFSPSNRGGDVLDSSNSLFSNQDPWTLHQDTYFPPPRPNRIQTKREGLATGDPFGTNRTIIGGESNIESADEVHQPLSHLNKNLSSDHKQSTKGSAEDLVKKELQAVAEGVAASVFHPSSSSNPDISTEINASGYEGNQDTDVLPSDIKMQHKAKFEEIKTKQPDRTNFGFRISDGIGRLQIIKDSDLEELWEIGSGTFGTVYHGKWRGTDVAIKRINDRCFAGKPSEQERMIDDFWSEAIKLADLHHPNVVAFYGVVLDGPGGSVATVTEYMVNGSLRNALQKTDRNLDKRMRLLVAMDVAFGMEYLHGKNIVHFDLKSDNLLVNLRDPHRPICKVGDLGLSKVKCQTLISGGVRGTLPWMAPELLNGSSSLVSEKVDVFSFGIVMWELLTRQEPYADLHYGAIIGGIVSNTLRPPVPESCDPGWRSLMERCWSAEPSERPNFTEIVNELRSMATKIPPKGQNPQ
ncbi:hypothetical protein like AT3G46920 [Hibiscus trionum]|uniref:Protein kinase domain-containing protein n=1 Tax=Hibiscus trionum TaxID=183268 RepID=A0A9W7MBI5_HIBTR|nr:hypothetical protein like AT3G46920 [Hibiscus trionum]